ncbi:tRNA (adenosine(37)-N6)-dimethylallyltransferase MiaA [Aquaspirillum sp. LM1]|uniref:tRNA (adenosine(37)-N6)-dimethylallyltransferase MiaA n=1 Tax=Aquaspirillum sp. LM1 TaxID=1938604 RepID=UPI000983C3C7|nr:tRNA (adenosine(37)-N6)-dimethylallyltransferase MiaA [Aquaspirillum sp. LM1]AQR64361.1 tRNA (adenosine(37)-N6)-dimethylallyltransferase MiaA [Aquaspirillum sp. LM1]
MTNTSTPLPPAILLMGPTASGKTGLALALARHLPVEIISVDSALVYQDMDIGTAKPSAEEQAQVPHHLIDIIDPLHAYSAAQFAHDARQLMADITARGRVPLLAGGTMLYFKALQDGLSDLPAADPAVRAELDQQAAERGWPALHADLARIDPATAERLAPNDAQRIQRALEIHRLTSQPMSALIAERQHDPLPWQLLKIALLPSDRSVLHQRIATRFTQMLDAGLLDEVRQLRQRYPGLHTGLPSMRCVGYRQAWHHLDGDIDRQQLIDQGIAATRQLAKRQLTWLRGMDGLLEVDCLLEGEAMLGRVLGAWKSTMSE